MVHDGKAGVAGDCESRFLSKHFRPWPEDSAHQIELFGEEKFPFGPPPWTKKEEPDKAHRPWFEGYLSPRHWYSYSIDMLLEEKADAKAVEKVVEVLKTNSVLKNDDILKKICEDMRAGAEKTGFELVLCEFLVRTIGGTWHSYMPKEYSEERLCCREYHQFDLKVCYTIDDLEKLMRK